MRKGLVLGLLFLCINISASDVFVIDVENGDEKVHKIKNYESRFSKLTKYTTDETFKALSEHPYGPLHLKKISVGLAIDGSIGLGPLSWGLGVRKRFFFEKVRND